MPHLIDLRLKPKPQVVAVEKVVLKPRSFLVQTFEIVVVSVVISMSLWGISMAKGPAMRALHLSHSVAVQGQGIDETVGLYGSVSDISTSTRELMLKSGDVSYTVSLEKIEKVETNKYIPLTLSDIRVSDAITVQGVLLTRGGTILAATRIVSFAELATSTPDTLATTTATSTKEIVDVATSTDALATSTASSTETIIIATSTSPAADISSTTSNTASSTQEISSTTTPSVATSTISTSGTNASSTPSGFDPFAPADLHNASSSTTVDLSPSGDATSSTQ